MTVEMQDIMFWMCSILYSCTFELLMPSALVGSLVRDGNNGGSSNMSKAYDSYTDFETMLTFDNVSYLPVLFL